MCTGMALQCAISGSMSLCDTEIELRRYHWNCTCKMHNLNNRSFDACHTSKHKKVSFTNINSENKCSSIRASRFCLSPLVAASPSEGETGNSLMLSVCELRTGAGLFANLLWVGQPEPNETCSSH